MVLLALAVALIGLRPRLQNQRSDGSCDLGSHGISLGLLGDVEITINSSKRRINATKILIV